MANKVIKILRPYFMLAIAIAFCFNEVNAQCGNADGFVLPVGHDNSQDKWGLLTNPFGNYYPAMLGYHPGADLNLLSGPNNNADLGKPVYAAGNGVVEKVSGPIGGLGYLVAVKHTGSFVIQQKLFSSPSASYKSESVSTIYTIYFHINGGIDPATNKPVPPPVVKGNCVQKGTSILGYIMNPGGGPHLHFELRHPSTVHSPSWTLVGNAANWSKNAQGNTGYYYDLQKMIDAGMRDPLDFINDNGSPLPTAPDGVHDEVNCSEIRGWAMDRNRLDKKVTVEIYDGTSKIATTVAGNSRPDLTNAGIGDHAFSLSTPPSLKDGRSHTVRVRIEGESQDLRNSSRTFRDNCGARPSAIIRIKNFVKGFFNGSSSNSSDTEGASAIVGKENEPIEIVVSKGEIAALDLSGSESLGGGNYINSYQWSVNTSWVSIAPEYTQRFNPGTHSLSLTVKDSAGVTDTATTTIIVTETAATAPQAAISMNSGGQSGGNGQTLNYTVAPGGSISMNFNASGSQPGGGSIQSYEWRSNATVISNASSFAFPFAAASHTITLKVTNTAGLSNTATATIIVTENTASSPQAVISMSGTGQTGTNGQTLNYTVAPGGSVSMALNGSGSQPGTGTNTAYEWRSNGTVISNLSSFNFLFGPASHTITLKVTNSVGLTNTATATIVVSSVSAAPHINSVSPNPLPGSNNPQTLTINGSGFSSSSTVTLRSPTQTYPNQATTSITPTQIVMPVNLGTTAAQWTVEVLDQGAASGQFAFQVSGASTLQVSSISPASPTRSGSDQNVVVNGSGFQAGLTVSVFVPGGGTATLSGSQIQGVTPTSFTMIATLNVPGTYGIRVNNPGGGQSNTFNFTTQAPTVSIGSISPSSPTRSGSDQNVIVSGSGFQSGLTVTVFVPGGGTATLSGSQIQSVTASSFAMVVTLNVAGTYGIRVNNPDGSQSNTFNFTTQDPTVSISSVSPSSPTRSDSNQNVQVFGSNFQSGLTVTVLIPGGGTATLSGSQIQSVTSGAFTMVVTLNVAGQYGIRVNNPGGGQSNTFNFNVQSANPAISSVTPSSPTRSDSNQNVQVFGNNFQSGLTVTVFIPGGGTATLSGSQIQSVTSASFTMVVTLNVTGQYGIRVNNPGGGQSNTFNFNVQSANPSISSVSPTSPTRSDNNQNIQVLGSNFQSGLTVTVFIPGGGTATLSGSQIQSVTSSSFTMVVTLNVAGQYGIRVNNPGGGQSNTFNFNVQSANPSISSVSPSSPTRSNSNQNVQVFGSNFQSGLTVTVFIPGGGTATLSGSQIQSVSSGSFTMVITLNVVGQYGIRVNNPGGGQSNTFNFNVQSPSPSISSISPSSPTRSGSNQNVSVFGSNFQSGLTVFITFPGGGGTTLSGSQIQSVSSGSFVMVATLSSPGSWSIRVNNADGKQSNTFFFNVQ